MLKFIWVVSGALKFMFVLFLVTGFICTAIPHKAIYMVWNVLKIIIKIF